MARITPDRRRTRLTVQAEVTEGEPNAVDPPAEVKPELVIEGPNGAAVKLRFDLPPRP